MAVSRLKTNYVPFDGDGRKVVAPGDSLPGTHPTSVKNGTARVIIDNFVACGHSNHSRSGATLWVILQWCAAQRQPYSLRAHPGEGYYVETVPPILP